MGTGRKRVRFQDEIEHTERRRSGRIIALEEKKQQEKERKLALALAKKKNSTNHVDNINKEKGKAKINVGDHLEDSNEDEKHGPTQKGRKSKALYQLFSSNKDEAIGRRVFEGLSADSEHFDLEFSLNKRRISRKPQDGQPRTSRLARVSPKLVGRNNATHSMVQTQKRDMYWPPSNKPLVSAFLNANKPNIQLNKDPSEYKDSLLQFVEDLGPTAQRVATKKLEALKFQQLLNDNTPTPNLLGNVSVSQIIPQPTPQALRQPNTVNNAQMLSLALPFFNKPLTIPGNADQQNRNVNSIAGGVHIMDGDYKGKKIITNDNWNACAAALLSSNFYNNDKGKSPIGFESSNARGTMDIFGSSKDKMVSTLENVFGNIGQWNTSIGIPNISSSSSVRTHVYPTLMISGPQPNPLESSSSKSLSGPSSFIAQTRPDDTAMHNINLSGLSLMSQPRPEDAMPNINLSELSLVDHQPWPANSMSGMNIPSLLSQMKEGETIPRENLSGLTIMPSQIAKFSNELETSLFGFGTPYQAGDFQAIMDSPYFNNSPFSNQVISQMNPLGTVPMEELKSSSTLEIPLCSAVDYYGGVAALVGQPKEANPQPNLALQL